MNATIVPKPSRADWRKWLLENRDHPKLGQHFLTSLMPGVIDLQLENMAGFEAVEYIESMYVQPPEAAPVAKDDDAADNERFALNP